MPRVVNISFKDVMTLMLSGTGARRPRVLSSDSKFCRRPICVTIVVNVGTSRLDAKPKVPAKFKGEPESTTHCFILRTDDSFSIRERPPRYPRLKLTVPHWFLVDKATVPLVVKGKCA